VHSAQSTKRPSSCIFDVRVCQRGHGGKFGVRLIWLPLCQAHPLLCEVQLHGARVILKAGATEPPHAPASYFVEMRSSLSTQYPEKGNDGSEEQRGVFVREETNAMARSQDKQKLTTTHTHNQTIKLILPRCSPASCNSRVQAQQLLCNRSQPEWDAGDPPPKGR
jgi:hypothetical protein